MKTNLVIINDLNQTEDFTYLPAMVSVITPCYNQAAYLADCLDSLIAQTHPNWECLVMDDGSTDNSLSIAQHYAEKDKRIRYARQSNQGPSVARNQAIALTSGEYIMPLDADDRIDPTYLEKALKVFESNPEIKLVYSRCLLFGSRDGEMTLKDYSYMELMRGNIISNTSMYRRSDFLKISGYDENMRVGWEDWEFYLALLSPEDEVYKIEELLYHYRQKPGSRDNSVSTEQGKTLRRYIYLKYADTYCEFFEDPINLAYQVKMLQREVRQLQNKDFATRIRRRLNSLLGKKR